MDLGLLWFLLNTPALCHPWFINSAGGDVPVSTFPAQLWAAHLRITSMHAYEEKCSGVSAGC